MPLSQIKHRHAKQNRTKMIALTTPFSFLFLFKCSLLSPALGVYRTSQIPALVFHCLLVSLPMVRNREQALESQWAR